MELEKIQLLDNNSYKVQEKNNNWIVNISDLGNFYNRIASLILSEECLYYYAFNRTDSMVKPQKITQVQRKRMYELINGILKEPDKYVDFYKPILEVIDNIEKIDSLEKLENEFKYLGIYKKYNNSKNLDYNKKTLVKYVKADRGYGIFGEILSYTVEETLFDVPLALSKIAAITAGGTFSHGSDGIFYNSSTDTIVYGEAKFTEDLEGGINQALNSIQNFDCRLENDASYILRNTTSIKNNLKDFFETLDKEDLLKKNKIINIFLLHGVQIDEVEIKKILSQKIDKFNKICKDNKCQIRVIIFPIYNKYDLLNELLKGVGENV